MRTRMLCCPLCKGSIESLVSGFACQTCGSCYPLVDAFGEAVYDFGIHRPKYLVPASTQRWHDIQQMYETWDRAFAERDNRQEYSDEIESVREIYTTEFCLKGSVLDVGGHQGRLRHYLADCGVPVYVSVDPFIGVFRFADKPSLLQAYPCLLAPCNFLSCHAEHLPFGANTFDWVHMRSVVDHFADPYLAFREAYRVLKPNGHLLIGLAIVERIVACREGLARRIKNKLKRDGGISALKAVISRVAHAAQHERDDHNFRLTHLELLDLISATKFEVVKEHWQKPPYRYVVYISARKMVSE